MRHIWCTLDWSHSRPWLLSCYEMQINACNPPPTILHSLHRATLPLSGALFCSVSEMVFRIRHWADNRGVYVTPYSVKGCVGSLTEHLTPFATRNHRLAYCLTATYGRTFSTAADGFIKVILHASSWWGIYMRPHMRTYTSTDRLVDWLIDWLIDRSVDWLIDNFSPLYPFLSFPLSPLISSPTSTHTIRRIPKCWRYWAATPRTSH